MDLEPRASIIDNFRNILGSLLIETFFAIMLYGISLAQAYVYYFNRKHDGPLLQGAVFMVMFIETVHNGLLMHAMYHYTILSSCVLPISLKLIWSASLLIETIVQIFYIHRIWILTQGNKTLTYLASAFFIVRSGFGTWNSASLFILNDWTDLQGSTTLSSILESGVSISAATDLLITGIIVHRLYKSRTGLKETDHLIQRLMMYLVHTGAVTALSLIIVVILFATKNDLPALGLYILSSKFFANSFLGTLNARLVLRNPVVIGSMGGVGGVISTSGDVVTHQMEFFPGSTVSTIPDTGSRPKRHSMSV
ncbi:hypothetical protein NLI96_g11940 [Meripilus lineatus]|uniref:DUF6534 domain-containing protein n=1 Tax=Meripilus lineatus TaxID=2056292 RepID=A0AAD5YCY2_9APHY|nr:hypothetical protein NLI96_g11940 [Physisporinus lineatus]